MIDQPGLNHANYEMGGVIHSLPDIYNVQVPSDPFPIAYLPDAKIIHYFNWKPNSTYLMSDKKIRMLDLMDPMIQRIIDEPKTAFKFGTLLHKDDDRERIMNSNQYLVLSRIYTKHPSCFRLIERIIDAPSKIKAKTQNVIMRIKNKLTRILRKQYINR